MKRKVHYAWIIAVFAMLISGAGSGIFISTLGVFVKPVCELYGFQRASFTLYSTIFFIVLGKRIMPGFSALYRWAHSLAQHSPPRFSEESMTPPAAIF